jgi:zinc protease
MNLHFRLFAAGIALLLLVIPARAMEIREIRGSSGVSAWLVEDYTVPLVTVAASFRGGSAQDPEGREGMAALMAAMFDEGAGELDSQAFQARMEELGIDLSFSRTLDSFTLSLRSTADDAPAAFQLLRSALIEPRFDEEAFTRMKEALSARLLARANSPRALASDALRESLYADHPYGRPADGTLETLAAITPDELAAHRSRMLARDNLVVSVVGAIDAEKAAAMLDLVFGALPASATLAPVAEAAPRFGERIDIPDSEATQAALSIALPAVKRDDPAFFAAFLANQILGGGTFSSRLYEEVREKRGLAYSVSSSIATYDHSAYLSIGSATRADRVDETLDVIIGELRRMAEEGPSADELQRAKDFVIGSYAIRNLDSSARIAQVLVTLQTENLGIDYIDRRAGLISAVSLDEVKAVAGRLLTAEPTLLVVAPPKS